MLITSNNIPRYSLKHLDLNKYEFYSQITTGNRDQLKICSTHAFSIIELQWFLSGRELA